MRGLFDFFKCLLGFALVYLLSHAKTHIAHDFLCYIYKNIPMIWREMKCVSGSGAGGGLVNWRAIDRGDQLQSNG